MLVAIAHTTIIAISVFVFCLALCIAWWITGKIFEKPEEAVAPQLEEVEWVDIWNGFDEAAEHNPPVFPENDWREGLRVLHS